MAIPILKSSHGAITLLSPVVSINFHLIDLEISIRKMLIPRVK